mgnify:CR=1 FL=1
MATAQRVTLSDGATTWTVLDRSFGLVEPVEAYLEYGRQVDFRPNTTKAYAQSLAQWWSFLEQIGKSWDAVKLHDFGDFISALRYGELGSPIRELRPRSRLTDGTVNARLRAVMSFYRYQAGCGIDAAPFLWKESQVRSGRYVAFLEHVARRTPEKRATIRIRGARKPVPVLPPSAIDALLDAEATYDQVSMEWKGDLRYRFLWALLAESGMRIGEALSLQHRDWHTGTGGDSARVAIVSRPHPHGLSAKSGAREVHVGSRLDRLYADYVWWLCDRGADAALGDWDSSYIFCNTIREPLFAPLRTESVYAHLRAMKRQVDSLPDTMTPHWFRHTHATALLLAGSPVHTVSRRLGHASVQTTMNTYGHVTEDAELAAVANWREYVAGWEYPNV